MCIPKDSAHLDNLTLYVMLVILVDILIRQWRKP